MPHENLDQKIARIGDPVRMLRNSPQGAYEFPIPNEFSNWGDEQAAWKSTAVLFDQSFHMTDVYFRGSKLNESAESRGKEVKTRAFGPATRTRASSVRIPALR